MTSILTQPLPDVMPRVTEIRHDLHRHPELGYQETYTASVIRAELERLGVPFTGGWAGGTGTVAIIRGRAGDGPCVALRADIDALPIEEATALPYASTIRQRMHACGHDGHTAILLGAAAVLQHNAAALRGSIKLIFQPAEEGGKGAARMCEEGALTDPKVDAIFGLHGWPGMKVGTVGTRAGPLLASVDGFDLELTGRGGHAATPQDTIDPIICGSAMVQSLQAIVARELDLAEPAVLTVSQFNAGTAFNVIPDKATLGGTVRALTPATRDRIIAAMDRVTHHIAQAHRCTSRLTFSDRTPATTNTAALAQFVLNTAADILGANQAVALPRAAMWGEDFAFYLQHVPGCFFVLGLQPHDAESYPFLHNARFDFNDAALPIGIRMMTALAERYLNGGT